MLTHTHTQNMHVPHKQHIASNAALFIWTLCGHLVPRSINPHHLSCQSYYNWIHFPSINFNSDPTGSRPCVCVCVFIFIHPPICQNGLSDSIVMHIHYNNVKPQSHTYHSFTEDERVCGVMVLQILSLQRGDIHVQCYFVLFPESELYLFVSAHFGLIYWTSLEKAGLPIRLRNANKNFGRIYICF